MTFFDLARACYPLLFANDDATYWISQFGTCFLASRAGRLFAITARHCVTPASAGKLLIACQDRQFAPLRAAYQRTHNPTLTSDEEDLYIVELDYARMSDSYRAQLKPLTLDDDPPMHLLHPAPDTEICIPGFPLDRAGIDYEKRTVAPKPTILAAWYVGGGVDRSTREVRFVENPDVVSSMDGFSGSPVFWVPKTGPQTRGFAFIGMLLRGNTTRGFFLSGSVVIDGLDDVMRQNPLG